MSNRGKGQSYRTLTKSEKELIEELGSKGVSDVEIGKQLNMSPYSVGKITTEYWKEKMKQKHEQDNKI